MKFHLHVVDGNAPASGATASPLPSPPSSTEAAQTTAVMLFAHMTLRCGHLSDVLVVSASTTPALAQAAALQPPQSQLHSGAAQLSNADASVSEDTQVLHVAGKLLSGAVGDGAVVGLPYIDSDSGGARIIPYAYFSSSFSEAEESLRRAVCIVEESGTAASPQYFDLIATTDMATFDYIIDYYQQQRVRHGGAVTKGRGTKPVGVMHIVADDPSRAALVLQRVVELMLKRSGWAFSVDAHTAEEEEKALAAQADEDEDDDRMDEGSDEEEGAGRGVSSGRGGGGNAGTGGGSAHAGARRGSADSWLNHIDEAVHLFAQLFGVDVLVALV
ncbi:hypothetical protein LSCM1_07105 [Leishmania martiniquensis]|uniref:Uncharacterized protein n=1 Tax=Leishmania martiniquensis TaxID=1580590 RepID=A0A836HJ10_9TRYP|nr:hypothetical protein LSCM1_07105 [Leishmania martiniquensis]